MTKQFISSAFVVAFSFLSSKADIDSAQEQYDAEGNLRGIVIHNPTAAIGEGEKQVKTPWMIMTPDGKSAFANTLTTNAISVVSENGTDYYAHIEGENGDRTKVIHFTVNENGIPSKNGDVIDTKQLGEEGSTEKMEIRKLIGVNGGYLYFYPSEGRWYGTSLIYNPDIENSQTNLLEPEQQRIISSFSDGRHLSILCETVSGSTPKIYLKNMNGQEIEAKEVSISGVVNKINNMLEDQDSLYTGDLNGYVRQNKKKVQLPGPISSLSSNGSGDVFATTPATNAFYNVTKGQYNVVTDQNGNVKPMIPKTKDGLIKVIDNRSKGGKFLCITTKGAHTIDE